MAQILAPSTQWQMRMTKNCVNANPCTTKMWDSMFLKQKTKGAVKVSTRFRVCAQQSVSSTVNRLDDLLNMDIRPYTDKIIAEYVWYVFICICLDNALRIIRIKFFSFLVIVVIELGFMV